MKIKVQSYITAVVNREIEVPDNSTYDELLAAARAHANSRISDSNMVVGYLDDEEVDCDELSTSFDEARNALFGIDADYTEIVLQNLPEEDAKNLDGPWPYKILYQGDEVIVRDWLNQLNTGTVVSVQIGEPVEYCKGPWQAAIIDVTDENGEKRRIRYVTRDVFRNLDEYVDFLKKEECREIEESARAKYEELLTRTKNS